jgi:hypothetical protein
MILICIYRLTHYLGFVKGFLKYFSFYLLRNFFPGIEGIEHLQKAACGYVFWKLQPKKKVPPPGSRIGMAREALSVEVGFGDRIAGL